MQKYILDLSHIQTLTGNSYRYKTNKGEISMLYPSKYTQNMYEIFCIEGDLFEDIERYDTQEEAEKRIYELLN